MFLTERQQAVHQFIANRSVWPPILPHPLLASLAKPMIPDRSQGLTSEALVFPLFVSKRQYGTTIQHGDGLIVIGCSESTHCVELLVAVMVSALSPESATNWHATSYPQWLCNGMGPGSS